MGEVHALLGENGAGKSTLSNILTGLYRPDAGEIQLYGQPVEFNTPRDALDAGICMVHPVSATGGALLSPATMWLTLNRFSGSPSPLCISSPMKADSMS